MDESMIIQEALQVFLSHKMAARQEGQPLTIRETVKDVINIHRIILFALKGYIAEQQALFATE